MYEGVTNMIDYGNKEKINFIGNVAMTLNPSLNELMLESAYKIKKNKGKSVNFKVVLPSNAKYMRKKLIEVNNEEYLPDIITSVGFEQIFDDEFIENFIKKGVFYSKNNGQINEIFDKSGCIDPEGIYEIFAATPYVFLIDKNKLGNRPIPTKLGDLLKDCYRNQIIVNGEKGKISFVLLLYIFKEFGMKGISKIKLNVKDTWHGSKMAWIAGNASEDGAAIYIIPWIFAKACPKVKSIMVIWPEDGAIISPMFLISKKSLNETSREIYNVISKEKFGNIIAKSFYLSASSLVKNNIPRTSKIKWLGWKFIRENNIYSLKKLLR
ncbi:ABC transporter substrate-binding protein [Clostridium chromiireducens]|uniref:ABC transporter substrate-binding protein n=2 Tax=Clostridium chromiireducens TaxID=225345 RepID=A0A399IU59_9CLOT|nr:ABC transporter substrate-binding protein [Clostridium chromiireducens]